LPAEEAGNPSSRQFNPLASPIRFLSIITISMRIEAGKTVYEISVADLQTVAKEVLERELTDEEIVALGNSVGDYIDWFQAIENAIHRCVRRNDVSS
jgi:hypothetical protein